MLDKDLTKFIAENFEPIKSWHTLEDEDPLGRPVWSFKGARRPSEEDGQECRPGETGKWEMINNTDMFQIKIEAFKYEPEDISINLDPDFEQHILVCGKKLHRETKEVIDGTEFERRFSLPADVHYNDLDKIYSQTGVVVIEALKNKERII